MADLLNASERVTLLCGAGCEGAHDELLHLAEALRAPVVHAIRGKERVEWDNPYDVGMTGDRRLGPEPRLAAGFAQCATTRPR